MSKYHVKLKAMRDPGGTSPGLQTNHLVDATSDEAAVGLAVTEAGSKYPEETGWIAISSVLVDRPCKWCGGQVTSRNPELDFCEACFYQGRPFDEICAPLAARLKQLDGIRPETVGVWHTGGGCFALGGTFADGAYFMATDAQAGIPDQSEGPWMVGYYRHEDDEEGVYEGLHETGEWKPFLGADAVIGSITRLRERTP